MDELDNLNKTQGFEQEVEESNKLQNIIFYVLGIAVLGFLGWYFYSNMRTKTHGEIVFIDADNTHNITIKPEDPGGLVVNNLDKEVYHASSGEKDSDSNVKLLPPTEEPVNKHEVINNQSKQTNADKPKVQEILVKNDDPVASNKNQKTSDAKVNKLETKNQEIINTNANKLVNKVDLKSKDLDHLKKNNDEIASNKNLINKSTKNTNKIVESAKKNSDAENARINNKIASDAKQLTNKASFKKSYFVQVGSFKSSTNAEKEWQNILKKSSKLFKNMQHFVFTKNIEGKGIFYRLQVGPFVKENDAFEFIKKLRDHKISCFIIRPEK